MYDVFFGIDPSLTGTGISIILATDLLKPETVVIKSKPQDSQTERISDLLHRIKSEINPYIEAKLNICALIEGYSFGSKNGRAFDLAELGGGIKQFLFQERVPTFIVPPTVLKKFISGKGSAKKEQVLLQVYKQYGKEFRDNNEADAFVLAQMGVELFNQTPRSAKNELIYKAIHPF